MFLQEASILLLAADISLWAVDENRGMFFFVFLLICIHLSLMDIGFTVYRLHLKHCSILLQIQNVTFLSYSKGISKIRQDISAV